jgi:hypothetical protein
MKKLTLNPDSLTVSTFETARTEAMQANQVARTPLCSAIDACPTRLCDTRLC